MGRYSLTEGHEFLTAEEVAAFLRIPLSTVYKLTQDEVLPAFKVGKHWRYRRGAIENKIKELEAKGSTKTNSQ
jgi:excisionase family DNA binding protein